MAALLTKRILRWGLKDVGLRWTRHSAAHWPPGPFSAHTKERGTKTLKAGAAPQRKHLLVIVFDCIMKMMFFFNLGLLRPHYFPSGHLIIVKKQPLTCPMEHRGGKYWKWSKDLPTLYFNPSCVSSVLWQKHKYVDPVHYRMGEYARPRFGVPPLASRKDNDSEAHTHTQTYTNGSAAMLALSCEALRRLAFLVLLQWDRPLVGASG